MPSIRPRSAALFPCVALATAAVVLATAVPAGDAPAAAAPWSDWSTLQLKARKMLFFTGKIQMELRREGEREILETRTFARFLGMDLARSHTISTFDARTGRTLELKSVSPERGRHYIFGEKSYTVKKLSPVNGFDAPLSEWKVKSTQTFDYPEADCDGPPPPVYDYYGMIIKLRDAGLERTGDEARFYVATSKGPRAYRVRLGESRESRRTFRDLRNGGKGSVATREFRLRLQADDPDEDEERFLSMEGEIELWVESRSKTLLEIQGKVPKVPGRVHVAIDSIG